MKNAVLVKRVLIAVFAISIIPILLMGFYARPLWDDYTSVYLIHYISKNYSPLLTFLAPFIQCVAYYLSWQGTYSAEFMFVLQPGAWPIPAYWVTTFVMVGIVTAGYIFFGKTIAEKVFSANPNYGVVTSLMLLLLQFQYVPYIHQTFYWYNGAVYYSFFYGLFLIELSIIISYIFGDEISKKKRRWILFFVFIISGGNYSTALINLLILLMLSVNCYMQKKDKFRLMRKITIVAFIGLAISMVAPGNHQRAATANGMSPIRAIISAIIFSLKSIRDWFDLPQLGLFICLVALSYFIVRKSDFEFKYPVIALGVMFGLFAAQIAPPFYGLSNPGDHRQIDMYYYSFYILMAGYAVYLVGWTKKFVGAKDDTICKYVKILFIVGLCVMSLGVFAEGYKSTSFYKTASDIISGSGEAYAKEYDSIIEEIKTDDAISYVSDISTWTYSLDKLNITEDGDYWVNKSLADYFDKEKVILKN